jgi:hypothetical protein
MPMDEPSDLLYRLDRSRADPPVPVRHHPDLAHPQQHAALGDRGLSDYMTGIWRSIDLMTVRDAAVADIVPKMSDLQGYGGSSNPRLIYNLGHAASSSSRRAGARKASASSCSRCARASSAAATTRTKKRST